MPPIHDPKTPGKRRPKGDTNAPWQKGHKLEYLQRIKAVFDAEDARYCYGAFTRAKENAIADWLAKRELWLCEDRGVVMAAARLAWAKGARPVMGLGGPIATPLPGACLVKRMACLPGAEPILTELIDSLATASAAPELWLEGWQESPAVRRACDALGAAWAGGRVLAASELVGVYYRGPRAAELTPPAPADLATLCRLPLAVPPAALARAAGAVDRAALAYASHYSGYNKGKSWAALALRGFGGDAGFIIKPAEMARKWKLENPDKLGLACADTPLRAKLPALEALIAMIPGAKERIRLMRLAPGGGELGRHADITDPDAGTADGRLMRIHIPLTTNPGVLFRQWRLDGGVEEAHMPAGSVWSLDTRKPHQAWNRGPTPRVHLVMDCVAGPALRALLAAGKEAPVAPAVP
jgi:hypothetical protein